MIVFQKQPGFIQQKLSDVGGKLFIIIKQPFGGLVAGGSGVVGIIAVTDQVIHRYIKIVREFGQCKKIRFPVTIGISAQGGWGYVEFSGKLALCEIIFFDQLF